VPPGSVFGHKGTCEKAPWNRSDADALILCAIFNSYTFDWCIRRKIAASVSLFMLNGCPAPSLSAEARRFLAHGALLLSCQHTGYDRLWREQTGTRPSTASMTLADRAVLRAAIDAVVAAAYGLRRDDYHHILSDFGHKTNPASTAQCREAFDLLIRTGPEKFYELHDPFADVPLVSNLSQPDNDRPTASATLIPSIPAERIPPA
jgi:hypothetical protein